jgi:hypothetical protein
LKVKIGSMLDKMIEDSRTNRIKRKAFMWLDCCRMVVILLIGLVFVISKSFGNCLIQRCFWG